MTSTANPTRPDVLTGPPGLLFGLTLLVFAIGLFAFIGSDTERAPAALIEQIDRPAAIQSNSFVCNSQTNNVDNKPFSATALKAHSAND